MRTVVISALLMWHVGAVRRIVTNVHEATHGKVEGTADSDADAISKAVEAYEQEVAEENTFLSALEMLKEDPANETLQSNYRSLLGEVVWESTEEETAATSTSASVPLGEMAAPGEEYNVVELVPGLKAKLGRLLTHEHYYMIEKRIGVAGMGESKYVLEGNFWSTHSRMYVLDKNGKKMYVLRRSFSYINGVARAYGQYSYRVIKCEGEDCDEGEILYTITKDRIGRGFLFGRDEWRVFNGHGGCGRWASGLFSCNKDQQILYSLSSGVTKATSYNAKYYQGDIKSISYNPVQGDKAYTYSGNTVHLEELDKEYLVASSKQVSGSPRFLNWTGLFKKGIAKLFQSLVWTDAYRITFEKPTDSLLVYLLQAAQDVTYDVRNARE